MTQAATPDLDHLYSPLSEMIQWAVLDHLIDAPIA